MTDTINLKSDFEMPATHSTYSKNKDNMTIYAESDCPEKARKVCADLELALEYGAFPAAHAVMIQNINEANREGRPLACSMKFTP